MYQQEIIMPEVAAQKIADAHQEQNFLRNSKGDFYISRHLERDLQQQLDIINFPLPAHLFILFFLTAFIGFILFYISMTLTIPITPFLRTIFILLVLVFACLIIYKNRQECRQVRQEFTRRFAGFEYVMHIILKEKKLYPGQKLVALFKHKMIVSSEMSQIPTLKVRLCCYEVTERIYVSYSEFEKEALWQSSVQEFKTTSNDGLRVKFDINIPENYPLSTPKENIIQGNNIGHQPPRTHILWLLELHESVIELDWYVPIEVTTPAHELAQVVAIQEAVKAKKSEQARHGVDWDRDF